jgi:hypothetical protein
MSIVIPILNPVDIRRLTLELQAAGLAVISVNANQAEFEDGTDGVAAQAIITAHDASGENVKRAELRATLAGAVGLLPGELSASERNAILVVMAYRTGMLGIDGRIKIPGWLKDLV